MGMSIVVTRSVRTRRAHPVSQLAQLFKALAQLGLSGLPVLFHESLKRGRGVDLRCRQAVCVCVKERETGAVARRDATYDSTRSISSPRPSFSVAAKVSTRCRSSSTARCVSTTDVISEMLASWSDLHARAWGVTRVALNTHRHRHVLDRGCELRVQGGAL